MKKKKKLRRRRRRRIEHEKLFSLLMHLIDVVHVLFAKMCVSEWERATNQRPIAKSMFHSFRERNREKDDYVSKPEKKIPHYVKIVQQDFRLEPIMNPVLCLSLSSFHFNSVAFCFAFGCRSEFINLQFFFISFLLLCVFISGIFFEKKQIEWKEEKISRSLIEFCVFDDFLSTLKVLMCNNWSYEKIKSTLTQV